MMIDYDDMYYAITYNKVRVNGNYMSSSLHYSVHTATPGRKDRRERGEGARGEHSIAGRELAADAG